MTGAAAAIASIPSPSINGLSIGPVTVHLYGLMIALGVMAAIWLCQRRWAAWGHDPDFVFDLALRAVPAGVIGARLYHVATDFNRLYVHNLAGIPKIWDGGLGIPGGIIGGVGVGWWYARKCHQPVADLLDMVAPALPLAQAIGRLGNYFNQELFGRPSSLPWAVHIDAAQRPVGYTAFSTFQPTFLYELIWNLLLVGVLLGLDHHRTRPEPLRRAAIAAFYGLFALGFGLDTLLVIQRQTSLHPAVQAALVVLGAAAGAAIVWWTTRIDRRGPKRTGDLFLLYLAGYFLGRLWVESLRIDTANLIAGLRINEWTSLIVGAGALTALAVRRRATVEESPGETATGPPAEARKTTVTS